MEGASIGNAIMYLLLSAYIGWKLYYLHHIQPWLNPTSAQSGYISESTSVNFTPIRNIPNSLSSYNSKTALNTKKLFVMTCLLSSVLRFMSFTTMAIVDLSPIRVTTPSEFDDNITGSSCSSKVYC